MPTSTKSWEKLTAKYQPIRRSNRKENMATAALKKDEKVSKLDEKMKNL